MSVDVDTAYILAGGDSRRMGRDKLRISINGTTLLEKTIGVCQNSFSQVKIVTQRRDRLKRTDLEILHDWPESQGPLAGVIASLIDCPNDCCFITAADFYDLDETIIEMLKKSHDNQLYLGIGEGERIQPLCGIYAKKGLDQIISLARNGITSVSKVISRLNPEAIEINRPWRNINSPDDMKKIGGDDV